MCNLEATQTRRGMTFGSRSTPQGAEGCYDFVGQNYLENGIPGQRNTPLDHCVVLEDIPPEYQISVEPGDVVGFYSVYE